MIQLTKLKNYWENLVDNPLAEATLCTGMELESPLRKVYFVTDEGDIKDFLADITPEQQPFAIVLIPSSTSQGSEQDNFEDTDRHLFYVFKKEDAYSQTTFEVQEELQPLAEALKIQLVLDKNACNIWHKLNEGTFHTDPERKLFSKCTGWSVSFNS